MSLDIVVVNYKTPHDLDEFLESLAAHPLRTDASLTIVHVDTDKDHEETRQFVNFPARIIGLAGNVGYAHACNFAATRGHRDYLAFFNADVVLTRHAIDLCHDALIANPDWAILGPCQVDGNNRIRHGGIFGTSDAPVHRGWNESNRGQYTDVRDAISVSGSAYFIRCDIWHELTDCPDYQTAAPGALGAFLPTPHYYEETFCSYHARAHGHRVIYYGYATIVHKWHQASPVGGYAEAQLPASRQLFRRACDIHGITHD